MTTTMADRIRAMPGVPRSDVAKSLGTSREYVTRVRWRDRDPSILRRLCRDSNHRNKTPAEARTVFNETIDKQIVIRRVKKQSYGTIAKALGLANRNVVAGRITRMRKAGKVVP